MTNAHNHELGALEARVDMILSGQLRMENRLEAVRVEIVQRLDNHSRRIRRLELWQAGVAGGGLVIGYMLRVWTG